MSTPRLKPLSDQVVVVTGASSGIGRATAEAALAAGARVVVTARNEAALAEVAALAPDRTEVIVADLADDDATDRIAAAAIQRFGGFDTWVNNAAAASIGRVADTPLADQRRAFDVGYWGTVRGSLTALAHLRDRGGAIVNLGSIESDRAVILQATYSAMKHAVKGFTDAFRTEVEADDLPVSVTLIKPAAIHTPFPEHARNVTGHPVTLPPVIYAPTLVARAILFAAANPRRTLSIGGTGVAATLAAQHFPRLTDLILERFGEALQTFDRPAPADRADNLWEARADAVDSAQDVYVRTHSLWLEAQLRPGAAALGVAAAGFAGLATRAMTRRR